MVEIGKTNKLKVVRREEHGFYLDGGEEWGEILLPNKYIPKGLSIGDETEVFIYFDSDDLIIATTLKPLAQVGEFAVLEVLSIEEHGVFLKWGLLKDLFVPFREQFFKMVPGESYVVYVYVDSSERIAASTRVTKFLDKSPPVYEVGELVDLLLYQETDLGYKAVINGRHSGQIFRDDVVNHLKIGQRVQGYIKQVRPDKKIDLSLRPLGGGNRNELVDLILQKLEEAGGFLNITAKTPAETINEMFKVSRKKFKVALGFLYKKKNGFSRRNWDQDYQRIISRKSV